jgi:predicted transcriptional regulator
MSITVPADSEEQIIALAEASGRKPEALVADAIRRYIEREADVIAKIRTGLADADRGETFAHEDVMEELEAIVAAAEQGK